MLWSKSVVAAAMAAAASVAFITVEPAQAGPPNAPTFLFFSGTDLWRYGAFLYGGAIWSPGGLDSDGFTLKALFNGGRYTYSSGTLNSDVSAVMASAAIMPGWRFSYDKLIVSLFVGPVAQDYRLTPNDPASRLHGFYLGSEFSADIWYQPTAHTMASVNGTLATIGPTGSLRTAFGVRVFDKAFVGPEIGELWCGNFEQVQFGAHLTGLRTEMVEWSAAGGWSLTSDQRQGPYLRLGVNVRY
jgi:hypothetical protein